MEASKSWFQGLAPASSKPAKFRRRRFLTFLVVLVVGAGASWAVFALVRNESEDENQLQFEQQASQIAAELQTNFDLSLEHLLAIPPFFSASADVTRQEFSRFVSPALKRHSSIYVSEFLPRVPEADRAAFEVACRRTQSSLRRSGLDFDPRPGRGLEVRSRSSSLLDTRSRHRAFVARRL